MKKPGLGTLSVTPINQQAIPDILQRIAMCVEIMMGRRGTKTKKIARLSSATVAVSPTSTDHNAVVADIRALRDAINQLLDQVQDDGI